MLAHLSILFFSFCALIAILIQTNLVNDRPVETLHDKWASSSLGSKFMQFAGMAIHYRDEGNHDDPEPIFLLHGTSASLHTWDGWTLALLKDNRRIIRIDLPGFGLTGPIVNGTYDIKTYSAVISGFLNALDVPPVVLGGNSLGGCIAWRTALEYPTQVSRLILVDSSGYPMESSSIPIGFRMAQLNLLKPIMTRILPRAFVKASVQSVYHDASKVSEELVDRYYELTLRAGNRAALFERFRLIREGDQDARSFHLIKGIRQATLILWGAEDKLLLESAGRKFEKDIANSEYVVFDDLGHVPQEEDPARSVLPVLRFLRKM